MSTSPAVGRKGESGCGWRRGDGEGIKLAKQPRPREAGRVGTEKAGSRGLVDATPEWLVFLPADSEEPLAFCAGKR